MAKDPSMEEGDPSGYDRGAPTHRSPTAAARADAGGPTSSSTSSRGSVHQSAQIAERSREHDQRRAAAMRDLAGGPVTSPLKSGRPGWRSK
jgi:hypothetical protein